MSNEFQIFDETGYLNPADLSAAASDRVAPIDGAAVVAAATAAAVAETKRKPGRPKKAKTEELPAVEAPPAKATRKKKASAVKGPLWRVSLNCPTPLAHRTLDVEAKDADDAKEKYHKANGLSGSEWVYSIEQIA